MDLETFLAKYTLKVIFDEYLVCDTIKMQNIVFLLDCYVNKNSGWKNFLNEKIIQIKDNIEYVPHTIGMKNETLYFIFNYTNIKIKDKKLNKLLSYAFNSKQKENEIKDKIIELSKYETWSVVEFIQEFKEWKNKRALKTGMWNDHPIDFKEILKEIK